MTPGPRLARLSMIFGQWLLLTFVLAAAIIYSAQAVNGLLNPHIDGSWPLIVAFVTSLLLAGTIGSYPGLAIALALHLLGAAAIFAALIVTPAIDGSVVWTTALRNYAINQLVILPLILALPSAFGGLLGALARATLDGRGASGSGEDQQGDERAPAGGWWETYRRE